MCLRDSPAEPGWSENASEADLSRVAKINERMRKDTATVTRDLDQLWTDYAGLKNTSGNAGQDNSLNPDSKASLDIFERLVAQGKAYMTICSTVDREMSKLESSKSREEEQATTNAHELPTREGSEDNELVRDRAVDTAEEAENTDAATENQERLDKDDGAEDRAKTTQDAVTAISLPDSTKAE